MRYITGCTTAVPHIKIKNKTMQNTKTKTLQLRQNTSPFKLIMYLNIFHI